MSRIAPIRSNANSAHPREVASGSRRANRQRHLKAGIFRIQLTAAALVPGNIRQDFVNHFSLTHREQIAFSYFGFNNCAIATLCCIPPES
jgi:hypothetical protein